MAPDRVTTGSGWAESPELERRRLEIEDEYARRRRALDDERAEATDRLDEMARSTLDAVKAEMAAVEAELLTEEARRRDEDRSELLAFERRLNDLCLESLIDRTVDRVTGLRGGAVP